METRVLSVPGRLAVLALLALFPLGAAWAEEGDPPGRVARLSDAEGSVSLQPAGVQEWAAATLNRPLTTGDKLWTDQNSRAELDIGAAVIRLGATTGFSFLNLDDNTAQMQVTAGTLIVRVRDMQANQTYEVDTPNLALSLQQPGEYRVEVNDAGDTTVVKVSEGQAQAAGGGQSLAVGTQQLVRFTGTDTLSFESASLGAPDDLDSWSAGRERQVRDSPSRQYVAEDVAGTQDLDNNGRWQSTPEYGYVWAPTVVVAGWAPYRFGHWVWIVPWGWTWVDDAPWGYAPFHYGRWVELNSAWCWVPGPRRVRPVYAPALVAWVGGPAGGVSVAFGANVGWFPLAPREVYVPGYHVSPTYVRNVNITNTTIVNNTYITNVYQNNVTNIHYVNNTAGAVTAVPQNVFTSGQRVGGHVVHLPAEVLARAATAAPPAIVPIHQSVLGPNAGRAVARPPAALVGRPVVARTPPPRAPVPFDRQVAAIQQNGGRPLARADLARLQPAAPVAPVRIIAAGGAAVGAGAVAHGSGTGRPSNPATPTRPGASAPPASAGAQAPNFADRERVLQNSRVAPPPRDSSRPPAAARSDSSTTPISPSQPPAPQSRTDRPPSAPQPLPPTQQHASSPGDPTHAYSRPPAEPVNRPPPAAAAPVNPIPRAQQPQPQPQYQEQRYRPPAPAAPPPPAPVRQAPISPPVSRPQERPAAPPPPAPVREAPTPPPVSRPQERPAAAPPPAPANRPQERPAAPAAPRPQEAKPESRDSGPHADRTSRDRAER